MIILTHFIINFIIGFLIKLQLIEILLLGLGGILIDIDHILYMVFGEKIYSLNGMIKFHKANFKAMKPHFYLFHFIEVIIILLLVSDQNWYLFLIFFGFLLHYISDFIKYIYVYKGFYSWTRYFSLIVYLVTYKKRK